MAEHKLAGAHGHDIRRIRELLPALLETGPTLVWCEPAPGPQRIEGLIGLWTGPAAGLRELLGGQDLEIEEARLFWPREWLHLRRLGERTLWAVLWEGEAALLPGWLKPVFGNEAAVALPGDYEKVVQEVLALRDFRRYGLREPASEWCERLRVVEYRQGTQVAFWRLEEVRA
jgi:hypothetical protein